MFNAVSMLCQNEKYMLKQQLYNPMVLLQDPENYTNCIQCFIAVIALFPSVPKCSLRSSQFYGALCWRH